LAGEVFGGLADELRPKLPKPLFYEFLGATTVRVYQLASLLSRDIPKIKLLTVFVLIRVRSSP
jgi:hypothetical protein